MKRDGNLNGGYIGILVIFISASLIIFFMVRTDMFTGQKDGKNMIERGIDAEKSAQSAKDMMELNNRTTVEGL